MSTPRTLEVRLNDLLVGYLTHYRDEKTIFVVDESYLDYGAQRPILSLSLVRPNDDETTRMLLRDDRHKSSSVKAPPFFSNLLPEGGLRKSIARHLKIHEDREFLLLSALGKDLPGAVTLTSVDTPGHLSHQQPEQQKIPPPNDLPAFKFSLGGMQMKFSMLQQGERFTLAGGSTLGNYIVKPPSHDFEALPRVEAATMETARAAGIHVPEITLLEPHQIHGLPEMGRHRQGEVFYAIRRFDRTDSGRVHVEDFAQVFNVRPHHKYDRINYDMIGRVLSLYAGGLPDLKEMARRLVMNVLIGNGDAHIKNWSLIYDTPHKPRLSPAYDLVSTVAYSAHDTSIALNMAGVKFFQAITLDTFNTLFTRIGLVDQARDDVMEEVRRTGQHILATWQHQFEKTGVPAHLIARIAEHQAQLPLTRDLASRA